jgi:hypothetical protein
VCEGCPQGLVLRSEELDFSNRHTVHGIEKLIDQNGWTVEDDGTAWCPNCAGSLRSD